MPLTDAWCQGWGLPLLSELWRLGPGFSLRGFGMPKPDPIWLTPQSVGDVLDRQSIDPTSAVAFSLGGAGLVAPQLRMGTSGTGLGSGSRGSSSGLGS